MRRAVRRVGAPDHQAAGVGQLLGIEARQRGAEHVGQHHMARLVAHGVGVHFGGAEAVEEAAGKAAGDHRQRAGVMGVIDGAGVADFFQPRRDIGKCRIPGDGFENAFALFADAAQRNRQALFRIAEHAVIGNGAFSAELSLGDVVLAVAHHILDHAAPHPHRDAAGIITIARAGGFDERVGFGHGAPWLRIILRHLRPAPPTPI